MTQPRLAFFCELEPEPLLALLDDTAAIAELQALGASIHLGLLDLSAERAAAVRALNDAGIPVVAWLLLLKEQGYWFNLDNTAQATRCYDRFLAWARQHDLSFAGMGIDVEPAYSEMQLLLSPERWRLLPTLLRRAFDGERLRRGQTAYAALLERMRADGFQVASYQIPLIVDDRRVGSTLLQRLFGIVDVPSDREVLMLYSSFLGQWGPGMLWSYAPEAGGIGVGSTGGGVEAGGHLPVLTWDGLARDLRLAHRWTDEILVFSLEGCVRQGFLERLATFQWDGPVDLPRHEAGRVDVARAALRSALWAGSRPGLLLGGLLTVAGLVRWLRWRGPARAR